MHVDRQLTTLAHCKTVKTNNKTFNPHVEFVSAVQDVVRHGHVVGIKVELVLHVLEEPAHHGSEMDHMRRLVLFKDANGIGADTVCTVSTAVNYHGVSYRRSPSLDDKKTQVSSSCLRKRSSALVVTTFSMARPTSPLAPVTRITDFV